MLNCTDSRSQFGECGETLEKGECSYEYEEEKAYFGKHFPRYRRKLEEIGFF